MLIGLQNTVFIAGVIDIKLVQNRYNINIGSIFVCDFDQGIRIEVLFRFKMGILKN